MTKRTASEVHDFYLKYWTDPVDKDVEPSVEKEVEEDVIPMLCPWCGSDKIGITSETSGHGESRNFSKCFSCGARGPDGGYNDTRNELFKLWNLRYEA